MFYEICKAIFYLFGILAITYELWSIKNYEMNIAFAKKAEASMKDKSIKFTDGETAFGCLQCLYCFWATIGLFSSQWLMFLILIVLSFIKYIFKSSENVTWFTFDAIISVAVILFAILNTYHLHI